MQESRLSIGVVDPEDSTDLRDFYRWLGDEEEPPARSGSPRSRWRAA